MNRELEPADAVVVFDGLDTLRQAFDRFTETYHRRISPKDALMIGHNIHKLILQNVIARLVEEPDCPSPEAVKDMMIDIAETTWREALDALRKASK